MYLLFNKSLLEIMGANARKSFYSFGLEILPKYQFLVDGVTKTIAKILDENKASEYINNSNCVLLTLQEANSRIDEFHTFDYTITNEAIYNADVNKKVSESVLNLSLIDGSWTIQQELEWLFNQGVAGIKSSNSIDYFIE